MPNTKLRDWRIAKWAQNAVYSAISQAKILTGYAPNVVIPSAEHNELFNQASVAIAELQTAGTLLYNDQLAMVKGSIFAVVESGEVKLRQCIADQSAGFNPDPEQNSNVLPFPNALSAAEVSASVQVDSNVFPAVNGATVQAQIQQLVQRTAFLRNTAGRNLPVGALMFTAAETADQGWLALTESTQLVSVTQYPEAFAKLGTRFGGNGTTTFGLPTIAEGRALLFNGASASGTVTTGEVKAHTHTISGTLYREDGQVENHIADGGVNAETTFRFETTSTGGSANLAAGVKFLLCIKMFDVLSANHYEPAEGGNYIWPEKVVSLGSVSGDVELDFSAGTVFEMTVTDDVIFSAENVPVPGLTYEFGLRIVNGGAHSITWPDGWTVEGALSADGISVVQGYIQSTSCTAWVMYAASSSSVAALIADLANNTDPAKGAGMVGDVKFGTAKAALDRVISALRGDTGKSYRVVSAILRNTGSGWFVLDDGGHNPIGVNSVTVNEDGSLHVDYDNLGQANIVNTLLAVPDETFASMGIVMGSSVSNEFCNIYLYAPLDFRIDLDTGTVSAPDFFYPEISMGVATDAFTINHPHIVYADNTTLSASPVGGAASLGAQAKTSPISNTSTTLEINTTLSTYIAYDGSAFTCSFGNSGTQITAAWNGALLNVTRPDVGVNNIGSINITTRYPYQAFFDGMSGANADIRFCTKAGVDVVTPDTNMRITYSETFPNVQAGEKKLTSGVYQFSANLARINANNLASAGGNIWLFGVMEEVV